jgi:methionyl-tRNA formyltransferase
MRIIFMGTPEIAVPTLNKILQQGHRIEAVFTRPDRPAGRHQELTAPPVKRFAEQHNLKVYQPAKIKTDEVRSIFETISPDVTVVVAYGRILPPWLLEIPRRGCLNVHFSLLPKYRGAAPVNWAIAMGETETGITTMFMDPGLDTGPILLQQRGEIGPDETAPELAQRLALIGADLLAETLEKLERDELTPLPQDDSQASLAPMLKREDGYIDWQWTANEIRNRVRGFQPWPGAWTTLKGHRLIFWRASALAGEAESDFPPGTVSQAAKDTLVVTCGNQSRLRVEELQLEGKRRMNVRDFLNGTRLEVGMQLG